MARTFPSCVASAASDLESGDSTVVLLLNFGGILQQKACSTGEYAKLYIKKKCINVPQRCVPLGMPKIMFRLVDFLV